MKRWDICWSRCCMAQKAVSAPRVEDAIPYHKQAQPPMAHVWGREGRTLNLGGCLGAASTGQTYNKGCRYTRGSVEWVGVTQDWLSLSIFLSQLQPCRLSFLGQDSCSWGQQQSCTNRVATRPRDHWPQPPGILSALHKAFICTPWARRGPAAPSSLLVGAVASALPWKHRHSNVTTPIVVTPLMTEPVDVGRVGSLTQHLRRHLPQFLTWFM